MKIGLIGEQGNFISHAMLEAVLRCDGVEVVWFVEARMPERLREKLYGKRFNYGPILGTAQKSLAWIRTCFRQNGCNVRALCRQHNIDYLVPRKQSINHGLPEAMYCRPDVDYVLIAGCDQILKGRGLKLARKKIINYHYSALPAYRGKYTAFWQWYNGEPYIGFSFHEVDRGVDTGRIIYQDKVDIDPSDSYETVIRRVIERSAAGLPRVVRCLRENRLQVLSDDIENSFYPAVKYLDLLTADREKSLAEVRRCSERLGRVRLKNGLVLGRILTYGPQPKDRYEIDREGITIPLADGYLKATVVSPVPFWLLRHLVGRRRLLRGLDKNTPE